MPRSTTTSVSIAIAPSATVDAAPAPRAALRIVSNLTPIERAERELAHFTRPVGARDATVTAVLATIAAHHHAVLAKRFTPRAWPDAVTRAFGNVAAIAIRLECSDHPAEGPTSTLEKLAAERVVALVEAEGPLALLDLRIRAEDYCHRALRAYAKALAKREVTPG